MVKSLVVVLLLFPVPAAAQTVTGTVQGTVRDSSRAVLPGVNVTARNLETGQSRETVTNDAGYYVLPFLPLGEYTVAAQLSGFKTIVRGQTTVALNETRVVDFELEPAKIAETVTVTAATAPILGGATQCAPRTIQVGLQYKF